MPRFAFLLALGLVYLLSKAVGHSTLQERKANNHRGYVVIPNLLMCQSLKYHFWGNLDHA